MKHPFVIGWLLLLALSACWHSVETQNFASLQPAVSEELQSVDSLMWLQPDSALALLLPWFDTCGDAMLASPQDGMDTTLETHSMRLYNHHYAHLLLSELLYKNDYAQANREELRQAVAFFDSIMQVPELVEGPSKKQKAFLCARAHYINGVGYYERDSVVEACREYIRALETMESHFEEMELVGEKARFMAYTYNRLGDLFEEQLLAESAIVCYKQALYYCKQEPTSIYGIPITLYKLGIQFDIAGRKDSAAMFYDKALAYMPDNDNIHYRDIMVNKALLAYNTGICIDSVIKDLKFVVSLASDEEEKTTRFLTIGDILFEEKQYDSSRFYLETVFEQQEDIPSKILAAENLCDIYLSEGDSVKARQYTSFLADYTMKEIEKKTDISKVYELFKEHLYRQKEKQEVEEREQDIKKTMDIIIPIVVIIASFIFIVAKIRSKSKHLLKKQQEEADRLLGETERQHEEELRQKQVEAEKTLEDREKHHQREMEAKEAQAKKELEEIDKRHAEAIEAERQTHRMEQAAISGRLKRKNQEVRELKDQIKQLDDLAAKTETAASFNEEPICRLIMERVHDGQFKSKIDCKFYKSYALDKQQLLDLRMAVDRHFNQFTLRLRKAYPNLTSIDVDYCCLYLLNLTYADVSALMQRAYNTVVERDSKIQKVVGTEKPLSVILMDIALNPSSV